MAANRQYDHEFKVQASAGNRSSESRQRARNFQEHDVYMDTRTTSWIFGSWVRHANTAECPELARGARAASRPAQGTG